MKKKIIFVTEALWIGGIETALTNLLACLDYEKYDVSLLLIKDYTTFLPRVPAQCRVLISDRQHSVSFQENYPFKRLFNLLEEPLHATKARNVIWKILNGLLRGPELYLYARYIRKNLKNEHFDTAIIYSDRTAEIAVRAIRADRFLLFYHNARVERAYHDEIAYKRCEKIISVSQKKCEELKRFRPRYANKMLAIHNIVNVREVLDKSRKPAEQMRETGFRLVTCGRLCHQKGIDWAILSCKRLLDMGYHAIQWYIVGGGPDENMLKQLAEENGVMEHFHFLGMQKNPYPYIRNADLYVQPSRYENYSVVILEAMALGRPILATIPAAEEQIKSGENGFLCEASPEAIAGAIAFLYQHPEEREKYVKALSENGPEQQNIEIMKQLDELL